MALRRLNLQNHLIGLWPVSCTSPDTDFAKLWLQHGQIHVPVRPALYCWSRLALHHRLDLRQIQGSRPDCAAQLCYRCHWLRHHWVPSKQ